MFTPKLGSLFSDSMTFTDTITSDFIAQSYHHLVSHYSTLIITVATFYLAVVFIKTARDGHADWMITFWHMIKVVFFMSLALNYDTFYKLIYNVIVNEPMSIMKTMISANGQVDPQSVSQGLDQSFAHGMKDANNLFGQGGWKNSIMWVWGGLVFIATLLNTLIAFVLMLYAKMGAAIILFLCPLFATLALFEQTKGLFDSYVKHLVTFALIPIMTAGITVIGLAFVNATLGTLTSTIEASQVTYAALVPYIFFSFVQFCLYLNVYKLSASLGSGFSLGSLQQGMAHTKAAGSAVFKTGEAAIKSGGAVFERYQNAKRIHWHERNK